MVRRRLVQTGDDVTGKVKIDVDSVAEAYLALLRDRGVEYLFGNSGTDFPSIIEALSKSERGEARAPVPVTVPHENLGVSMAHGYYLATGRPQACMFHVNVGTANGICAVLNAARENVPILFTAGRTPITEAGPPGTRSIFIHWGQEMFDQAGMLREAVKWDYELRRADQIESVVDRALIAAMSEPRGPVYLSLPREVLAEDLPEFSFSPATDRRPSTAPGVDPAALEEIAAILANADNPLIITGGAGRDPSTVEPLAALAERFAVPVVSYRPRYLCFPDDHPMHVGYEPAAFLKTADAVLVLETDVPWIPSLHQVNESAKVIHIGVDPHFLRLPIRGFPAHIALTASCGPALRQLHHALEKQEKRMEASITARRERIREFKETATSEREKTLEAAKRAWPIAPPWLAHCIDSVKGEDGIVVNEAQLPVPFLTLTKPGSWYSTPTAGGLGWGMGAALGIKLADRERFVINVLGDGAYMFNGPTAGHYVGNSMNLPILYVILNNSMWGSVRKATLGLYPDGYAAESNRAPLTYFDPAPEYEKVVETCGGKGFRVEDPQELPAVLSEAAKLVKHEHKQAVVNVLCGYPDSQARQDASR